MDIEDIGGDQQLEKFVSDLATHKLSEDTYEKIYIKLRKKYKLSPSVKNIRKVYFNLLAKQQITHNKYIHNLTKKKVRSSSGIVNITVLTSPYPEYTDENGKKITQSFSCGKNCAYCPNEPEIRLKLIIKEINDNNITVYTDDNLQIIRVINYIIYKNKEYNVIKNNITKKTDKLFIITLQDKCIFNLEDKVIGVKITQPRSYLSTEPAVLRANKNNYNTVAQMWDRMLSLQNIGHKIDKLEVFILGGTWSHYPVLYQQEFVRDLYYACNMFTKLEHREKYSLEKEIELNAISECRVIGLTIETRPDCITKRELRRLRTYYVTRIQIGVQHIDDNILKKINRGCTNNHTIKALALAKHNGFKVDIHLMPDLPGSSYKLDYKMFKDILSHKEIKINDNYGVFHLDKPEYQADQWKIYPCSTLDWTQIKEWYDTGEYKPYSEDTELLIKLLLFVKTNMFEWIRLNRIIRDIPNINILGGNECVHLRDVLQKRLKNNNQECKCIRCREVKNRKTDLTKAQITVMQMNDIKSTNSYFIKCYCPETNYLYGFLRLRINCKENNNDLIHKSLIDCAMIRELHVYGNIVPHNTKNTNEVQHQGFGTRLMNKAEELAKLNNCKKIAVISGIGVTEYYKKKNYKLVENYMIKELDDDDKLDNVNYYCRICVIIPLIITIIKLKY